MWPLSETVQIAVIATLVPSLVAILNYFQGRKIHVLVNSNMTAVKSDLAQANTKIGELNTVITKLIGGTQKAAPPADEVAPEPAT